VVKLLQLCSCTSDFVVFTLYNLLQSRATSTTSCCFCCSCCCCLPRLCNSPCPLVLVISDISMSVLHAVAGVTEQLVLQIVHCLGDRAFRDTAPGSLLRCPSCSSTVAAIHTRKLAVQPVAMMVCSTWTSQAELSVLQLLAYGR
jgi:hypothetical protein